MEPLQIQIDGGRAAFAPGETIEGQVQWTLDDPGDPIELRLFWYTEGKGSRDAGVAAVQEYESSQPRGHGNFSFQAPAGPNSFSGRLVSIVWALELVAHNGAMTERVPLVVGPGGREIRAAPEAPEVERKGTA